MRYDFVTKHKFICPTHSEIKQTERLELGPEKNLLQNHTRRWVAPAPKPPTSLKGFGKVF